MAYDAELEKRIDAAAAELDIQFQKKKMFGGVAYLVKTGHLAFAVRGEELLFRVKSDDTSDLLEWPGVHTAIMGQRLMSNWLQAGGLAIERDEQLEELMTIGYDYAMNLPPKSPKQ